MLDGMIATARPRGDHKTLRWICDACAPRREYHQEPPQQALRANRELVERCGPRLVGQAKVPGLPPSQQQGADRSASPIRALGHQDPEGIHDVPKTDFRRGPVPLPRHDHGGRKRHRPGRHNSWGEQVLREIVATTCSFRQRLRVRASQGQDTKRTSYQCASSMPRSSFSSTRRSSRGKASTSTSRQRAR